MTEEKIRISGKTFDLYKVENVVVGSGCAAFNCVDWLYTLGKTDTVIITEGINSGTSRNAGSDKQTYYKLSLASDAEDSVEQMAMTLFSGKGADGDIALAEAANSVKCFMKLANLGVGFPTNRYGEYVGYKTDHDPRCRATSAGPLTSKDMTEALEKSVRSKNICIKDGMLAVKIAVKNGRTVGLAAINTNKLDENYGITLFVCKNIILATGGPAGIYKNTVYPESQHGMSGMAFEAGAEAANLQEWQYGLASVDFRWNVSGTYQQVLPRYVSVDEDGTEREFLKDYIDKDKILLYQFRKGYQWPFTEANVPGSSEIDIAVQKECAKNRKVYMDFTQNPDIFTCVEELPEEAEKYLVSSGAVQSTPIERLMHMNPAAVELYKNNGIDITVQKLRIAVCAQHCNGGISVDSNWQTRIKGLYVAGEAAGTFGVHRPGGSALNSTQVGSMRAAEHIAYTENESDVDGKRCVLDVGEELYAVIETALRGKGESRREAEKLKADMSDYGANLRNVNKLKEIKIRAEKLLTGFFDKYELCGVSGIPDMMRSYDAVRTTSAVADAMKLSAERYGNRGSCMTDNNADIADRHEDENCVVMTYIENGVANSYVRPARSIPERDGWFETVWADYKERTGK